jgi:hypothetical protein
MLEIDINKKAPDSSGGGDLWGIFDTVTGLTNSYYEYKTQDANQKALYEQTKLQNQITLNNDVSRGNGEQSNKNIILGIGGVLAVGLLALVVKKA